MANLEDEDAEQAALEDCVVSSALGHAVALAQLYGTSREDFIRLAETMWLVGVAAVQTQVKGGGMTLAIDANPSTAPADRIVVSSTNKKEESS